MDEQRAATVGDEKTDPDVHDAEEIEQGCSDLNNRRTAADAEMFKSDVGRIARRLFPPRVRDCEKQWKQGKFLALKSSVYGLTSYEVLCVFEIMGFLRSRDIPQPHLRSEKQNVSYFGGSQGVPWTKYGAQEINPDDREFFYKLTAWLWNRGITLPLTPFLTPVFAFQEDIDLANCSLKLDDPVGFARFDVPEGQLEAIKRRQEQRGLSGFAKAKRLRYARVRQNRYDRDNASWSYMRGLNFCAKGDDVGLSSARSAGGVASSSGGGRGGGRVAGTTRSGGGGRAKQYRPMIVLEDEGRPVMPFGAADFVFADVASPQAVAADDFYTSPKNFLTLADWAPGHRPSEVFGECVEPLSRGCGDEWIAQRKREEEQFKTALENKIGRREKGESANDDESTLGRIFKTDFLGPLFEQGGPLACPTYVQQLKWIRRGRCWYDDADVATEGFRDPASGPGCDVRHGGVVVEGPVAVPKASPVFRVVPPSRRGSFRDDLRARIWQEMLIGVGTEASGRQYREFLDHKPPQMSQRMWEEACEYVRKQQLRSHGASLAHPLAHAIRTSDGEGSTLSNLLIGPRWTSCENVDQKATEAELPKAPASGSCSTKYVGGAQWCELKFPTDLSMMNDRPADSVQWSEVAKMPLRDVLRRGFALDRQRAARGEVTVTLDYDEATGGLVEVTLSAGCPDRLRPVFFAFVRLLLDPITVPVDMEALRTLAQKRAATAIANGITATSDHFREYERRRLEEKMLAAFAYSTTPAAHALADISAFVVPYHFPSLVDAVAALPPDERLWRIVLLEDQTQKTGCRLTTPLHVRASLFLEGGTDEMRKNCGVAAAASKFAPEAADYITVETVGIIFDRPVSCECRRVHFRQIATSPSSETGRGGRERLQSADVVAKDDAAVLCSVRGEQIATAASRKPDVAPVAVRRPLVLEGSGAVQTGCSGPFFRDCKFEVCRLDGVAVSCDDAGHSAPVFVECNFFSSPKARHSECETTALRIRGDSSVKTYGCNFDSFGTCVLMQKRRGEGYGIGSPAEEPKDEELELPVPSTTEATIENSGGAHGRPSKFSCIKRHVVEIHAAGAEADSESPGGAGSFSFKCFGAEFRKCSKNTLGLTGGNLGPGNRVLFEANRSDRRKLQEDDLTCEEGLLRHSHKKKKNIYSDSRPRPLRTDPIATTSSNKPSNKMERSNMRNQTVAVAGRQFNPLEQDEAVLRKGERSNTLPTSFRRGDIEIKEADLKDLEQRQQQLKGRQRRGSINLTKVDEKDMGHYWEDSKDVELHLHGKLSQVQSDNVPGAEREAVLYKLKEPKLLQEKYQFIYSCVKGAKGYNDTTPNQDNFSYTVYQNWDIIVVMDGHGPCGHFVSARCVQTIPFYLCNNQKWGKGDYLGV
eukprot:g5154.t1